MTNFRSIVRFALIYISILNSLSPLTSCAVAPFATEHTAVPLGQGNNAIDFGLSPALYTQYSRGVTNQLDLGFGAEIQLGYSLFGWGKYSLLRQSKKQYVSVACVAGLGMGLSIINTTFVYLGPIISRRVNEHEFYIHPRFNHLRYGRQSGAETSKDGFDIEGGSFNYLQLSAGYQYFFREGFAFGLSGLMFPPAPGGAWSIAPGLNFLTRF